MSYCHLLPPITDISPLGHRHDLQYDISTSNINKKHIILKWKVIYYASSFHNESSNPILCVNLYKL